MADDEYKTALERKATLEAEIDGIIAELTSPGNPGLHEALVDKEGFPRADIDVYRVRQLRHTLAVKQTDHKLVMQQIEELLPRVFKARGATEQCLPKSTTVTVEQKDLELQPFAVVQSVQNESPAYTAGLQQGDEVLRFGTATSTNHRELMAIKDIVQHHVGLAIPVLVRRQTEVKELELIPQSWQGPGMLGCVLQPQ